MKTKQFWYPLPERLIAQHPAEKRGTERMMVLHRDTGVVEHRHIADIVEYLTPNDLLVVNDTKVFPARLIGEWPDTRGAVEVLLVSPAAVDAEFLPRQTVDAESLPRQTVDAESLPRRTVDAESLPRQKEDDSVLAGRDEDIASTGRGKDSASTEDAVLTSLRWNVIIGSGRKCREGQEAVFGPNRELAVRLLKPLSGIGMWQVEFVCERPLMELLDEFGHTPVPPYVKREGTAAEEAEDRERYQTIYAKHTGSVAAPTAGLHFTPEIFAALEAKGVRRVAVTLHVGPGTFRPVKAENIEDHQMDFEAFTVPPETAEAINACKARGGRVVCVGSTTVRTLETVAARPVDAASRRVPVDAESARPVDAASRRVPVDAESVRVPVDAISSSRPPVDAESSPRQNDDDPSPLDAASRRVDDQPLIVPGSGASNIFIYPPYDFKVCDVMLTNFHLPQSTLLMMISALAGRERVLCAYHLAVMKNYMFFSYGDCMLIV